MTSVGDHNAGAVSFGGTQAASAQLLSDTPETDANSPWRYAIKTPDGTTTHYVPADFARKLERERDDARHALQCHLDAFRGTEEVNVRLQHELNECWRRIAELEGRK